MRWMEGETGVDTKLIDVCSFLSYSPALVTKIFCDLGEIMKTSHNIIITHGCGFLSCSGAKF